VLGAVAVYDLLMNVLPGLVDFYHKAVAAKTEADVEAAGKVFAELVLRGGLDVIDIFFSAGALRRLVVLGGGRITVRAVWVYLGERIEQLMARLRQGAEEAAKKAKEAAKKAKEAAEEAARRVKEAAEEAARKVKEKLKRKKKSKPKTKQEHIDDLAAERQRLKLAPAGSATDDATVAKIKIGDDEFYGVNSKYQAPKTKVEGKVNAQTKTHAEGQAVQKAIDAGKKGTAKEAEMWVDRDACDSCGKYNGIGSLARELGVEKITVHSPSGTKVYYPPKKK
jgi:pyruvate/2-oxoglutarate dehydrogenase complex dihydrolipoamide acyltransferase (E2) component